MAEDCACREPDYETPVTWSGAALAPLADPFPTPDYPPREWFLVKPEWMTPPAAITADTDPRDVPIQKVTVDDDGRVAGYFYGAGQCLVHNHGACPRPSPTYYAAFHQSHVVCDDGEPLTIGVIGNVGGHADPYARFDVAQAHYADPNRQIIMCRAYDDEEGGFILGAVVPGRTFGDVALVRRSPLSGDWRPMPDAWWSGHGIAASVVRECEGYDCIGPTLVTRPGLPLVRAYRTENRAAAILGGLGGVQLDQGERTVTTELDLPGGIKVTQTASEIAPVGPQPGAARVAAPPPPPPSSGSGNAPAAPETQAEEEAEDAAVAQLQQQMTDVLDRLGACEDAIGQMMDMATGAAQAASAWPTEPEVLPTDWEAWVAAATKTEGGQNFPKGDYAYTPSDNPSDWKLRLTSSPGGAPDPAIVGAAAAALSPGGHRGQPVSIPDADRARVKAKVAAAWRKANPDKSADDMPDSLKP